MSANVCSFPFWVNHYPSHNPLRSLQGKYAEAEPLYETSQVIQEKVFGSEH
ncbi:unnamed protein product, partial [Ectocarpus sp. 12 AP-2014]